jgi:hypothetical protein
MKNGFYLSVGAAVAMLAFATPALAQNAVYMTGTSNPWSSTTNDAAMDQAFGAGNWTKFMGFDGSVFAPSTSFIFFDGSDSNGYQFADFINNNLSSLANFVNGGGTVFANAAFNGGPSTLDMGFGQTLLYGPNFSGTATLTAAGLTAGLNDSGAGNGWTGNSFSHNAVTGGTCLITGDAGCILAGGAQGAGGYFVGGQTTTNWHSPGNAAFQLRVNELNYIAGFQGQATGGVPEPSTWAMMLLGFGAIGAGMRRRPKHAVRVRFTHA